jgi:hypothetical protein
MLDTAAEVNLRKQAINVRAACRWGDVDLQDNPVRLTDGKPAQMHALPRDAKYPNSRFRTNSAIHRAPHKPVITNHTMVLFHYMSRSMEDFITRKTIRYTGSQSAGYASKPGEDPWDPAVMRRHEDKIGMRGDAPVCKAVAAGTYAERCCRNEAQAATA